MRKITRKMGNEPVDLRTSIPPLPKRKARVLRSNCNELHFNKIENEQKQYGMNTDLG
jgi:hypothetical protein